MDAPPLDEKRPLLIVEDALEMNPAVFVVRPVTPSVPPTDVLPVVVKFPTTVDDDCDT